MVTHIIFRCKIITYFPKYLITRDKTTAKFAFPIINSLLRNHYETSVLHIGPIRVHHFVCCMHRSGHHRRGRGGQHRARRRHLAARLRTHHSRGNTYLTLLYRRGTDIAPRQRSVDRGLYRRMCEGLDEERMQLHIRSYHNSQHPACRHLPYRQRGGLPLLPSRRVA